MPFKYLCISKNLAQIMDVAKYKIHKSKYNLK